MSICPSISTPRIRRLPSSTFGGGRTSRCRGFFGDYLYIPLGGNRKGALRQYANLLAPMLLVGLWHAGLNGVILKTRRHLPDFLAQALDVIDIPVISKPATWHQNLRLESRKWHVFQAALREIAASGCQVLLYNGPSSPAWRELSRDTFMDAAEEQYSGLLEREAAQYPNVHFIDFHGGWTDNFPDALFYDIQHLNRTGAAKLTMILCGEIKKLDLLSREPALTSH